MAEWKNNGKIKLLIIVGTRPEVIRLSAVIKKCRKYFEVCFVSIFIGFFVHFITQHLNHLYAPPPSVSSDTSPPDFMHSCIKAYGVKLVYPNIPQCKFEVGFSLLDPLSFDEMYVSSLSHIRV